MLIYKTYLEPSLKFAICQRSSGRFQQRLSDHKIKFCGRT